MKDFIFKQELLTGKRLMKRYSPQLLTALGIAGFIGAGIEAVRATPKAMLIKQELDAREDATKFDYLKALTPVYLKPLIMAAASTTCTLGATGILMKRGAALATAWQVSDTAYRELKHATNEVVGEDKMNDIYEKIAEDKIRETVEEINAEEIVTGDNLYLCYDNTNGGWFRSNETGIRDAFNDINSLLYDRALDDDSVTVNEVQELLGIKKNCKNGDELIYEFDPQIKLTPHISGSKEKAPNGEPYLVVTYDLPKPIGYAHVY